MLFFELTSFELAVLLFGIILGATALGVFLGRRVHHLSEDLKEPFGVLQGALLGVVGLILAFGLSLAVGRYETRREVLVDETNKIGTTYLRAQTLPEPQRSRSLDLLIEYTESAVQLSESVPGSDEQAATEAHEERLQRELWNLAGQVLTERPSENAPRLYVEILNEMIDAQDARVAALNNRVPDPVLILEVVGAAFALGLLAAYLAIVGRGMVPVGLAAVLVAFLLMVIFDLDRPTRGWITVPDQVLKDELASMEEPPAYGGKPG